MTVAALPKSARAGDHFARTPLKSTATSPQRAINQNLTARF
jgi:hypothetical protein